MQGDHEWFGRGFIAISTKRHAEIKGKICYDGAYDAYRLLGEAQQYAGATWNL